MTETLTPADLLGDKVWDALVEAGNKAAPQGSGADGFDILKDPAVDDSVVVVYRREGAMYGMGGNAAPRKSLELWNRDLAKAGFVTRLHEVGLLAVCLVVAIEERPADRALAALGAHAVQVDGGMGRG